MGGEGKGKVEEKEWNAERAGGWVGGDWGE